MHWNPIDLLGGRRCLICGRHEENPICDICREHLEPATDGGCLSCGNPSIPKPTPDCWWCRRLQVRPTHVASCYLYRGEGQTLMKLIKYQHYWRMIASILDDAMARLWDIIPMLDYEVIQPIPETLISKLRRPFNPAGVLARELSHRTGLPLIRLLSLKPLGRHQVGLDLIQRRRNLRHRFSLMPEEMPRSVLLVDDVITTGSTLEAATRLLEKGGARRVGWLSLFRRP